MRFRFAGFGARYFTRLLLGCFAGEPKSTLSVCCVVNTGQVVAVLDCSQLGKLWQALQAELCRGNCGDAVHCRHAGRLVDWLALTADAAWCAERVLTTQGLHATGQGQAHSGGIWMGRRVLQNQPSECLRQPAKPIVC